MGHVSNYGMGGGCAALCAFISWLFVQNRGCKYTVGGLFGDDASFENLQILHYIAVVIGLVIFVLSFFDLTGVLYEIQPLFYATTIVLFGAALMMAYAATLAFKLSCLGNVSGVSSSNSNVFKAEDWTGILIFALEILSSLFFLGAGIDFSGFF